MEAKGSVEAPNRVLAKPAPADRGDCAHGTARHRYLWQFLSDRRVWRAPAIWVLVLLVGVNIWVRAYRAQLLEEERQAVMGMAAMHVPSSNETIPRYDLSCGEHLEEYWSFIPDARRTRLVIITGMSQLFSVMDPQPGDQLTCQWLDDALAPKGTRVFGVAAANLCNEEAFFQFISLLNDPATRPKVFILPLCFDKMRDVDLRPCYERFLRARPSLQEAYAAAAHKYEEKYPAAAAKMIKNLAHIQESSKKADQSLEGKLRQRIEPFAPLVAMRKELNIQAQHQLYAVRNALLHIKSTNKRPMIQLRFETNWQFLQMMVDTARANGVQVVLYNVPINPRADNPYVPAEYVAFKERAEKYCTDNSIPYANFENVVPPEDWAVHEDGPDFKHFKGNGHKRTAAAILERFGPLLSGSPSQLSQRGQ